MEVRVKRGDGGRIWYRTDSGMGRESRRVQAGMGGLPQGPTVMSPLEQKRHWMLGPQPDHSGAQCAGSDHMPGVTRLQVLSQLLQFEEHFPLQVKEGNDSSLIL